MDDPHSDCPTLGQAVSPDTLAAELLTWRSRRNRADRMLDAVLAQAADDGTSLRRMRPVPKSTAAYRIARHRTRQAGSEAAA